MPDTDKGIYRFTGTETSLKRIINIMKEYQCIILGSGPAGIGAATELAQHGVNNILIIDRNKYICGLSRTEVFDGTRFDIGPHRFFTKNKEINELWHKTLGEEFIPVKRLTRIYYKNKYFNYPIKPFDVAFKLGAIELFQAFCSYVYARINKNGNPETFEDWIVQKFGWKLYKTFFKTYTEKVWGIPCNQIGAEWAAQRIKGLDIIEILKNALNIDKGKVKTLVEEFNYPVNGAGQMYETMYENIMKQADIMLQTEVLSLNRRDYTIESVDILRSGEKINIKGSYFFSTIPLTNFFKLLNPPPEEEEIKKAVQALYYRDHITVNLLSDREELFPDQWVYIHSPEVSMARLANYNNFSKAMVNYKKKSALSVEYFVFKEDEIWSKTDEELKKLALKELITLKLICEDYVEHSWVIRETESYPTYYLGFQEPYNRLQKEINKFENLQPAGRGGMYKYNNQDHSLLSGLMAARNYLKLPGSPYNLWDINIDAEYHEERRA